ncbi:MAG: hypothetical protein EOP48_07170 [Sphingobacteriales bacterium]|nr:MAG: hypothetical protein EOP48_07170 [Sphingobacteriales bacterium]
MDIYPQQADMFSGTWKYQNGQEVFIVSLWRTTEGYRGHYKKISVDANGNQISVVYDSNKLIGNTTTNWPYVIYAGNASQQNEIGAVITDNTVTNTPNAGGFVDGYLDMKVLNPNCFAPPTTSCALQAQWAVKKRQGLRHPNEPDFNIPTNLI